MKAKPDREYWEACLAQYAETAEQQRASALDIASKLETCTELHGLEAKFAAAILRGWARDLKNTPPRKRGQPPLFNHFDAQMLYFAYVSKGHMKKATAVAKIAEQYGVTIEAVKDCIKKTPSGVKAFFGTPARTSKQS